MICRMCLLPEKDQINIFGSNENETCIATVIRKHFWFEPKVDDPVSNSICNKCWSHIASFHTYYCCVEEAQRGLSERHIIKEIIADSRDNQDEPFEEQKDSVPEEKPTNTLRRSTRLSTYLVNKTKASERDAIIEDESTAEDTHYVGSSKENLSPSTRKPKRRGRPRKTRIIPLQNIARKRGRSRKALAAQPYRKNMKTQNSDGSEGRKILIKREKGVKPSGSSEYVRKSKETDEAIAKHMKLKCELCPSECVTFAEIRVHYRRFHKRKGYIVCCNKKFYRRILIMEHINKHLNPDYFRCDKCDKTFSDRQCLRNHMIVMHDPEERKIHKCNQCRRSYSKLHMLERHKLIHVPQEERDFFCEQCGKAFPSKTLLHSHIRSVHDNAYGIMCHLCAKVLQGKTMLAKHQLEHAGIIEPKVQCKECGSWLKHKYSLKKHMERHEERREELSNPQEQICNICGKVSQSKAGLRSHIKYVHQAKRIHQCNICEKSFKTPLSLKEHMTTHTGEVLYICPHCPKTFNSGANMHSHRKKAHRQEWEESRKNRQLAKGLFKNSINENSEGTAATCENQLQGSDELEDNKDAINLCVNQGEDKTTIIKKEIPDF